ncbi:MAG: tRNA (adenosine(37)-N6)-dimethylallyltransferase MiaA [Candidatus Latescibacterota bacterium]|nr:MAG: tRNA (adenosine(37)-N6)-dimethylallyltransferase MiaA [Candidatus Latescibacterota bacterium]
MVLTQIMIRQFRHAIAIMGATATGKSELAIRLAETYGGEVISMDSRQVYRGLDIGTGKISPEDQRRVPHHLIDVLDPHEVCTAGSHLRRAVAARDEIAARGRLVIYAGGTGLYFRVLFRGLIDTNIADEELDGVRQSLADTPTEELFGELQLVDPERASELSPRDRVRIQRAVEIYRCTGQTYSDHVKHRHRNPEFDGLKIVLSMPRDRLRERIRERTRELYEAGWVEEVRRLLAAGVTINAPAMDSLGYDLIAGAIERGEDPGATFDDVVMLTQQYAKRQETFFRSESDAVWFDMTDAQTMTKIDGLVRACLGL